MSSLTWPPEAADLQDLLARDPRTSEDDIDYEVGEIHVENHQHDGMHGCPACEHLFDLASVVTGRPHQH